MIQAKSQIRPRFTKTVLNDAEIKALNSGFYTLGPALGAGSFLFPLWALLRFHWVANYTGIDANSTLQIASGNWTGMQIRESADAGNQISGLLAGGADESCLMLQQQFDPLATFAKTFGFVHAGVTPQDNGPIVIFNDNAGAYTGGNAGNTLTIYLYYQVINS